MNTDHPTITDGQSGGGLLPPGHPGLQRLDSRDSRKFAFYHSLRTMGEGLASTDFTRFEYKVFSQNGEDGVTLEILRRIGVERSFFVEFGGSYGHEGNCRVLAELGGWSGLIIERDPGAYAWLERMYVRSSRVRTICRTVTPDSVVALLRDTGVPHDFDVLSIDIDGLDYYVWQALHEHRARLVIIEYNGGLPSRPLVQPVDAGPWDGSEFYGASIEALVELATVKGYVLAHTELTGLNAFFVRDDLVDRLGPIDPPRRAVAADLRVGGPPPDSHGRSYVVPVPGRGVDEAAKPAVDGTGP